MTKPSADNPSGQPLGLPLNDGLGPLPNRWRVVCVPGREPYFERHPDGQWAQREQADAELQAAVAAAIHGSQAAQDDAYVCGRNDERKAIAEWLDGQGQPGYAHEVRHRA